MKKFLLVLTLALSSLISFADEQITVNQIIEVRQETSTTKSGKEVTETLVIYKNKEGKRKLAYMTESDFKKLQRAWKYNLDVEYIIVETKTKTKLVIK